MNDVVRAQRDASLALVQRLMRRGHELATELTRTSRSSSEALIDVRVWQRDCATAIHELSGGSKAHWLSRAFSEAFLVRTTNGTVADADVGAIVKRLIGVLGQAAVSLETMDESMADAAAPVHRFDFVNNADLRPVLDQAYRESGGMLERGDYELALVTCGGILETILTDALEHDDRYASGSTRDRSVAGWSFDARIVEAERRGLIGRGCARLPPAARRYRDGASGGSISNEKISEREARTTRQVLNVIIRDLDPGR